MIERVLFPNVGRRCELVETFKKVIVLRKFGRVIGADIDPLAPGLQVVDESYIIPKRRDEIWSDEDWGAFYLDFCREKKVQLVVPTIDPDLVRLSRVQNELESSGTRVVLSPPDTIGLVRDKRRSRERFQQLGCLVPRSLESELGNDQVFPVFVKPFDGSAGQGAQIVQTPHLLAALLELTPNLMIEEVIDGVEITVDVLSNLEAKTIIAVPRRRIKIRGGEVTQGVIERDAQIEKLSAVIAEGFGVIGPSTVQFRRTQDRRLVAIEVNARVGGGLPLTIAAGGNWCQWILDIYENRNPELDVSIQNGLMMTRADRSFFIKPK